MVNVLKVYFKTEIRRIAINSYVINHYNALCEKVIELFPSLSGKTFILGWKDEEGDSIVMSSDRELAQAVACASEGGIIKVYVHQTEEGTSNNSGPSAKTQSASHNHVGVKCDGCNEGIYGYRYKCLQCEDYDLCHSCNGQDKHPMHDMLKMALPSTERRKWNFLGIRRIWSSMFGFHPFGTGNRFDCGEGKVRRCRMFANRAAGQNHKEEEASGPSEPFKCAEPGQDFLQNVGASVSNFLDAFGIDVKVYVEPGAEEQEQQSSEKSKEAEAQPSDTAEASAEQNSQSTVDGEKSEETVAEEDSTPSPINKSSTTTNQDIPSAAAASAPESEKPTVKTAKDVFMEWQTKDNGFASSSGKGARPKSSASSKIYPDLTDENGAPYGQMIADLLKKQAEKVAANIKQYGFQEQVLSEILEEYAEKVAAGNSSSASPGHTAEMIKQGAEKFAAQMKRYQEESSQIDDWTFLNSETSDENTIPKEAAAAMPADSNPVPQAASNLTSETPQEHPQATPETVAEPSAPKEEVTVANTEKSTEEEQLEPEVASALELMLSMGYNNDGGWLVRLLKNKHGNINETLDSLYQ